MQCLMQFTRVSDADTMGMWWGENHSVAGSVAQHYVSQTVTALAGGTLAADSVYAIVPPEYIMP